MDTNKEEKKPEPHVTILGGEVGGERKTPEEKRERRAQQRDIAAKRERPCCADGWVGGLVLIFAGAILILNNYGVISWEIWRAMASLWPALLIAVGFGMVLGRSAVGRFFSGIITLAIVLFVILAGLSAANPSLVREMHLPEWIMNVINQVK